LNNNCQQQHQQQPKTTIKATILIDGLTEINYQTIKFTINNQTMINHPIAKEIVADFIGIRRHFQPPLTTTLFSSILFATSSFVSTTFLSFSQLFNLFYRHRKAFRRKNSDMTIINVTFQHIQKRSFYLNLSLSLSSKLNLTYYRTEAGRQPFSLVERITMPDRS
jgi:hypothetical protein